jgi:adenylosuccinate lyase
MAQVVEGRQVPERYKSGFETYQSVYSFRYGSPEMKRIWSQDNYWAKVRKVWIAAADAEQGVGLVTPEQLADLKEHQDDLSVEEIFRLEKKEGHDVVAAQAEFKQVAPVGGEILHMGMTSEDALSNVEIMQIHESLDLVRERLTGTLDAFGIRIDENKDLVCMGYTHLQAAEPTTMGYRFAKYAQDLLTDLKLLDAVRPLIKGKGIKGAVGTSASFVTMLDGKEITAQELEEQIMDRLGLEAVTISDQTYPRKSLFLTTAVLSSIGQSLHRFGLDIQLLQSSFIDEVSEPRRKGQKGSSAMPHKQNPIITENMDSTTEDLPGKMTSAWIAGAFVTLERTLRDSAGKRSWLPESFLIVDEALIRAEKVMRGLKIHENSIATNLAKFAPMCATEVLLTKLVEAGADRQDAHELLVDHAETAVDAKRSGRENPFRELIHKDEGICAALGHEGVDQCFDQVFSHVGDASKRCTQFLENELYPAIGGRRAE